MNLHQFAETHEVTNQPPSLDGINLYRIDLPLQEWCGASGPVGPNRGSMRTVRWRAGR